jgi:hypothetical protein
MESAVLLGSLVKPKAAEIVLDPEQRRVMLIALALLGLRNVRIHPVPIHYPERNGSVVARNL